MIHAKALDATARREHGKILAALLRVCGRFELAEEALQDAYVKAHAAWPIEGMPANAAAWLTTVARHRLLDLVRRDARNIADAEDVIEALVAPIQDADDRVDSGIEDDRLRLIFTCCHPAISPSAATALALNTLCGLSVTEIARAFVEPETTTAQKLVRAKRKIREAGIPYVVPAKEQLPERLASVLSVIYLVFNEGYASTSAPTLARADLCAEALRLARLMAELMPTEPECLGLLALMLLTDARRDARAVDGELVPLEEQDRSRWNAAQIEAGLRALDSAVLMRRPGSYQLQAAISALHAQADSATQTDWTQISHLYFALLRHHPTPVVELNAAVALAMSAGIDDGLAWISRIEARGDLNDYHLLHAARADLLRRAKRFTESAIAYQRAIALSNNDTERRYLERRLVSCGTDLQASTHARPA